MATWMFTAEVFRWKAAEAWHFVALPEDVSDDVDARTQGQRAGFGSVRVQVTLGATTWRTSVFPDTRRGTYLLPLKKAVRTAEGIEEGDHVDVALDLEQDLDADPDADLDADLDADEVR